MIGIFSIWRYYSVRILSFNTDIITNTSFSGIKPVYIKAYPVGVDTDIKDSVIDNGIWTINPGSANYLLGSAGLGDGGNIVIYGHNRNDIFGPLRWVKTGAIISLTGSDEKIYRYEVIKTDIVSPNNLEYIKPATDEILTLYTCIGILDSKRFIVVAKRIN